MEEAILKTLIYSDIFDYPLKAHEIHKWMIGKKATLRQVEEALKKAPKGRWQMSNGYFFLKGRANLVEKRIKSEKIAKRYLKKILIISKILKLNPFIKMVGISGGLSMGNVQWGDDIDLFIITQRNRIFSARFLTILLLGFSRRAKGEGNSSAKVCINLFLEEDNIKFKEDLYLAHEILQMKMLWDRNGIYHKFIIDNEWVFKFLPNWTSSAGIKKYVLGSERQNNFLDSFERAVKYLQLSYMGKPNGEEKLYEKALFFHPSDYRKIVLEKYNKKIKTVDK